MARILTTAISLVLFVSSWPTAAQELRQSLTGTANKADVSHVDRVTLGDDESAEQEIARLFDQYKDALSNQTWDEADTLAKLIVDKSIRTFGRESKTTAVSLTNLAILQVKNADPVSAVQNFTAAIDIVEQVDNRLSSDLIIPLKEMGTAQLEAGNADRAVAAWNRAVHVSHVNFGPHNMEQVEPLYELSRMYFKAGMNKEAYKVRKRIYYLQMREADAWKREKSPSL
jgi:tetratricopeptide (TPR) repeat protein